MYTARNTDGTGISSSEAAPRDEGRGRVMGSLRAGCILRASAVLSCTLLLAACASGPRPVPPAAPAASQPAPGTATPAVTAPPAAPVVSPVTGLLKEARRACEAGDLQLGLARLDRALRIEAGDAALYLEMARCYRTGGDRARAAAAAERGMSYCEGAACAALRDFL